MQYYILSLTHTNPEALVWWGPNCAGYTMHLEEAGKYEEKELRGKEYYYDNKREAVAIPCHEADEFAIKIVPSDHMEKFSKFTKVN